MTPLIAHCLPQLKSDEGFRQFPYKDTLGIETIGYGRNLRDVGLAEDEAEFLLSNDIEKAIDSLRAAFAWFDTLNIARQAVLVNMTVNMGIGGLLKFTNTLTAIVAGDFKRAADEMLSSQWARQVPHRAAPLARQMEEGE